MPDLEEWESALTELIAERHRMPLDPHGEVERYLSLARLLNNLGGQCIARAIETHTQLTIEALLCCPSDLPTS